MDPVKEKFMEGIDVKEYEKLIDNINRLEYVAMQLQKLNESLQRINKAFVAIRANNSHLN